MEWMDVPYAVSDMSCGHQETLLVMIYVEEKVVHTSSHPCLRSRNALILVLELSWKLLVFVQSRLVLNGE